MPSTVDPGLPVPEGVALSWGPTADAFRRFRLQMLIVLAIAIALVVAAIVVGSPNPIRNLALSALTGVGAGAAIAGIIGARIAGLMSKRLLRYEWKEWNCQMLRNTELVLSSDNDEHILAVLTPLGRWGATFALRRCHKQRIWFAGDPHEDGVAAAPGGRQLVWARQPRTQRLRRERQSDGASQAS